MDFDILSIAYHYLYLLIASPVLKYFFVFCFIILLIYIYIGITSPSGIHFVNNKRQCLRMFSSYNPFSLEADYSAASYSGIKCTLKSDQPCYVQAFWGVPIYPLFELLHGDWQALRNTIITHIPAEKFSSKCICANDPFLLPAGEEKSVEFKPRWHTDESKLSQAATCMREIYPFVVLMVLNNRDDIHDSVVVAMASAIHIPDKHLILYPQLIGQYIKLTSGHVGQIKKIFLSSPATSDDDGDRYDLCLACYHRPVSRVFLPCRHACLCSVCFDLCEGCPVCRSPSMHYFELPDNQRRTDN